MNKNGMRGAIDWLWDDMVENRPSDSAYWTPEDEISRLPKLSKPETDSDIFWNEALGL